MTALAVEMLIWFCTRSDEAGPFEGVYDREPQKEIVSEFMADKIIMQGSTPLTYRATPKGQAWLKMICETPMPIQQWIDPRQVSK